MMETYVGSVLIPFVGKLWFYQWLIVAGFYLIGKGLQMLAVENSRRL